MGGAEGDVCFCAGKGRGDCYILVEGSRDAEDQFSGLEGWTSFGCDGDEGWGVGYGCYGCGEMKRAGSKKGRKAMSDRLCA